MVRRGLSTVTAVALLLALAASSISSVSAVAPGNAAFQARWERTDYPVLHGAIHRTWIWGPEANTAILQERYDEAPGGMRQVQYFDKSRMEINDPAGDPNDLFYVTNGLLVVELMTGRLQLGENTFEQYLPAMVNVAGDSDDPTGPTYATMAALRDLPPLGNNALITQRVNRAGVVTNDPSLAAQGVMTAQRLTVPGIDHQIAAPFWNFMTSSGMVFSGGGYTTEQLFTNPYYATGYPITEAYWANVKVADTYRDVLMQCFERRCLTYTPGNSAGFETEAGNVGQHYRTWRYDEIPSVVVDPCPETTAGTYVWVADTVNDRVQKFSSTGAHLCSLTTANTGGRVIDPWAIAVDANNNLWVHVDGWLHRFDYRGNWLNGFGGGQLYYEDIAVDAAGNVYGVDIEYTRVEKHSPTGTLLLDWGTYGDVEGALILPTGIDVDDDGNIYIVDGINQRVNKYLPSGAYSFTWGSGDTLYDADAITVDAAGNTYVTDLSIFVFDSNGALIDTWESTDEWSASYGIDIGANGYIYALDRINAAVSFFNSGGTRLGGWGTSGDGPGEFNTANSLSTSTR